MADEGEATDDKKAGSSVDATKILKRTNPKPIKTGPAKKRARKVNSSGDQNDPVEPPEKIVRVEDLGLEEEEVSAN